MFIKLSHHDSNLILSRKIVKYSREKSVDECNHDIIIGRVLRRILDHELIDEELREYLVQSIQNELEL
jgi:hypothetical protein